MKTLMLSIDSKICEEGSAAQKRMIDYGSFGDEIHIVLYNKISGGERMEAHRIARNVWIHPTNTRRRPLYFFNGYKVATPLLRKSGEWLITSQEGMTNMLAAMLCIRFRRVPLQVQIHTDFLSPYFMGGFRGFLQRMGYRIGIAFAAHIRVVSERIKQSILHRYHIPAERISVLPVFADINNIKNADTSINLRTQYPSYNFFVVMVGRLEPEKNVALALEAFRGVVAKYPKALLIIVGDGSLRGELEQKRSELSLDSNVVFAGDSGDVVSYYKSADAFLHSSDFEGFGLSLAEAAAAALPVVTTDVGLVGETLTKESALTCTPRDANCLKRNLLFVHENKHMRRVLGEAAQRAISRAVPRSYDRYLALHRDTLARAINRSTTQ